MQRASTIIPFDHNYIGTYILYNINIQKNNIFTYTYTHVNKYIYIYIYLSYVRLSKLLVHEKDIKIIWKCPIANHSFVAILPSLRNIDLQGVSLRLNAAEVDMTLYS